MTMDNGVMRERKAASLIEALALRDREHLALVGAGGKTTLLFALSRALRAVNRKVLTSTTTRVWYPEPAEADSVWLTARNVSWREGIRKDLEDGKSVFLGGRMLESGKVQGVDPSVLDTLYREEDLAYLFVEADGSAGHPVKAHSPKEPVVPGSATTVLAIMGVEVLGRPFTPELVFRADAFERITRIPPGEIITSPPLSRLFIHPEGLFKSAPGLARKVVFLNKADLAHDREQVRELIGFILADAGARVERVVVGSMRMGEFRVAQSGSKE
jgi:probable selenium-dependent hydroxylase accessory protein YqeC